MFNEGIRCSPFQITCRPPNHLANLPTMKATRNLKCSSQGKAPPSFRLECATPYPELSIERTNRNLEIYKYLRTRLSSLNSPLFMFHFRPLNRLHEYILVRNGRKPPFSVSQPALFFASRGCFNQQVRLRCSPN